MISADEVMRQLAAEEATATGEPAVPASSLPSTHAAAAIEAMAMLAARESDGTEQLIAYAQAEALISIALSLTELRNLLHRGKP